MRVLKKKKTKDKICLSGTSDCSSIMYLVIYLQLIIVLDIAFWWLCFELCDFIANDFEKSFLK